MTLEEGWDVASAPPPTSGGFSDLGLSSWAKQVTKVFVKAAPPKPALSGVEGRFSKGGNHGSAIVIPTLRKTAKNPLTPEGGRPRPRGWDFDAGPHPLQCSRA